MTCLHSRSAPRGCSSSSPRRRLLLPKPQCARVIMASFDDVEKAGAAVADIIAAGIVPAGLEMMDLAGDARGRAVRGRGLRPRSGRRSCFARPTARPRRSSTRLRTWKRVLERAGATRMTVSRDEAERLRLVGTQSGLSGSRAHIARLLLHGRHHPAQAPGRSADLHRRAREEVRPALPERVPRRRRQSSSADPVRRQQRRGSCTAPSFSPPRCSKSA